MLSVSLWAFALFGIRFFHHSQEKLKNFPAVGLDYHPKEEPV